MAKIAEIKEQITVPDGVTALIENDNLLIKGEKGELSRTFVHPKIDLKVNGKVIEITSKNFRRKEKALIPNLELLKNYRPRTSSPPRTTGEPDAPP